VALACSWATDVKLPVGGQLGPGGAADGPPRAAAEPAFDALAAQAPGDATWAVVGRPMAALPGAPGAVPTGPSWVAPEAVVTVVRKGVQEPDTPWMSLPLTVGQDIDPAPASGRVEGLFYRNFLASACLPAKLPGAPGCSSSTIVSRVCARVACRARSPSPRERRTYAVPGAWAPVCACAVLLRAQPCAGLSYASSAPVLGPLRGRGEQRR